MNTTAWVLIGVLSALVAWDVFAELRWGYEGTISHDVLQAALKYPLVPLAVGVVLGHLFWPQALLK